MAANMKTTAPPAVGSDRPILLVGLMGTGKTSIGRRLAKRLGCNFTDSDEQVEAAAGMTVSEIFDQFGEAYFRDGERRVLARLVAEEDGVIATGGGAFMNAETRALMLASGTVVWLDADIDTLVQRVARRSTRPLLAGRDPAEVLSALAKERSPVYAQAHIHVESGAGPIDEMVDTIIANLSREVTP